MKPENDDRRSAPRVRVALHLHIVYDDLDQLVDSYARDISEGGVFVETEDPLPLGSRIHLKISLVHQELMYIDALGEVVHFTEKNGAAPAKGMGVRFIEINPESKQFIREFVLSRLPAVEPKGSVKKAPKKKSAKKSAAPKKK